MLGNGVGGKAHPLHPVPSPPPHIFIPCPPLCGTCAVRARRRHVHGRPTVRVGSARVASGGAGRVGMAAATSRGAPCGGGARRVRWRRGGGRAQGGRPSRDARAKTPPPALLEGSVPDPPAPALVQARVYSKRAGAGKTVCWLQAAAVIDPVRRLFGAPLSNPTLAPSRCGHPFFLT